MADGFICNVTVWEGFPWYSRDATNSSHCPFTDDCDNFTPYDPTASSYTSNLGALSFSWVGIYRVQNGHLHDVVFTPGTGASFAFDSDFYDCEEEDQGCSVIGTLVLQNASSLDIQ